MSIGQLRKMTGAGLMDCKRALAEANGDLDAAVVLLKEKGVIKAEKKGNRAAAEGMVGVLSDGAHLAAMVEVNCETDFVSRGDDFKNFAQEVLETALKHQTGTLDALLAAKLDEGQSVEEKRQEMVLQIGENIQVSRVHLYKDQGYATHYVHGGRIAVMVVLSKDQEDVGRDVAMHVAATHPASISEKDLDPALVDAERKIYATQAAESNKPEEIQQRMVEGKVQRYIKEHTLLGQPFVKNPDQTVKEVLKASDDVEVLSFVRFELGEHQQVVKEDLANEVSKILNEG